MINLLLLHLFMNWKAPIVQSTILFGDFYISTKEWFNFGRFTMFTAFNQITNFNYSAFIVNFIRYMYNNVLLCILTRLVVIRNQTASNNIKRYNNINFHYSNKLFFQTNCLFKKSLLNKNNLIQHEVSKFTRLSSLVASTWAIYIVCGNKLMPYLLFTIYEYLFSFRIICWFYNTSLFS